MKIYSEPTGKSYDTLEDLLDAESNGYVVVGVTDRRGEAPWCVGPFVDKADARREAAKMRRHIKRLDRVKPPAWTRVSVRTLWKEIP